MKYLPFLAALVLTTGLHAQKKTNQIGLRIGEPMGLTYKKFLGSNALEFIAGTASKEWSGSYYRMSFRSYDQFKSHNYVSHNIKDVYYLHARYIIQKQLSLDGVPGSMDWFWGLGALAKRADVTYTFTDGIARRSEEVIDYDIMQESIIGLEYTFEEIPLSMFIEFSVGFEIHNRFANFRGFTGIGLRYNF